MNERVICVEFCNGKPFSVVTIIGDRMNHYDFEWSNREQSFLYERSSGTLYLEHGSNDYWVDDEYAGELRDGGGLSPTGNRLSKMPVEYPIKSLLDGAIDVTPVYCSVCEDFLPWSDVGDVCDHVVWCNDCGWWSGDGYEDSCK